MTGRIIHSDACVADGVAWLSARVPELAHAATVAAPIPLRRRPDGFAALLSAIVGQQVSVASAQAIWQRLELAELTHEAQVRAVSEEALCAAGLSRPKARYAKALAAAQLDYAALHTMSDAEVISCLTKVTGIGRWTADIYAMFALGRADVFAAGDLALKESARLIFALPDRPSEQALRDMAVQWSPWQAVAARIMWAYYKHAKQREGLA